MGGLPEVPLLRPLFSWRHRVVLMPVGEDRNGYMQLSHVTQRIYQRSSSMLLAKYVFFFVTTSCLPLMSALRTFTVIGVGTQKLVKQRADAPYTMNGLQCHHFLLRMLSLMRIEYSNGKTLAFF